MFTAHLKRGVKAGVVAGLVFGLFMAFAANPLVAFADGLGHQGGHHQGGGADQHSSAVSLTVTNGVSIVSGVLWGVLLGGVVFGVVYYFLEPAIPCTGGTKSYLLALAGFITFPERHGSCSRHCHPGSNRYSRRGHAPYSMEE